MSVSWESSYGGMEKNPRLAHAGYAFAGALAVMFAVEMVIFTAIVGRFKVSESPQDGPGKLKRSLPWSKKTKTGKVITLAEEGDDDEPTKQTRKDYLRWGFWGVSAVLLASYFFEGVLINGTWLYIIKAGLLTILAYGHLLYVEKKDELTSRRLWIAVLAPNPIVFVFIVWAAAWIETRLMDQIADDYRPWGAPSQSAD